MSLAAGAATLITLQRDVEHQRAAPAAPALRGIRPSPAAFLGLFAFSPPASHFLSVFPSPARFFQFLLQCTVRRRGSLRREDACNASVQDPTRQTANTDHDGYKLTHCLSLIHI